MPIPMFNLLTVWADFLEANNTLSERQGYARAHEGGHEGRVEGQGIPPTGARTA